MTPLVVDAGPAGLALVRDSARDQHLIPDPRRAMREAFRVLREGGRFLLMEHVRSPVTPVRAVQRMLEPLAVRFEADHLLREPLVYLREAGFEMELTERSKWGIVERIAARKPVRDHDGNGASG